MQPIGGDVAHYVLTVFRVGDSAAVAAATSRPEALLFLRREDSILGAAGFTLAAIATAEAATSIAGRRVTSVAAVLPRVPVAATTTAAIAAAEAAL